MLTGIGTLSCFIFVIITSTNNVCDFRFALLDDEIHLIKVSTLIRHNLLLDFTPNKMEIKKIVGILTFMSGKIAF